MFAFYVLTLPLLVVSTSAWTAPLTLFDPLVASKVYATAQGDPTMYPTITTDGGEWVLSPADTWTSGFFPATLYEMYKRECLCTGSTLVNGSAPDWLALGRSWSTALVGLHWNNVQGHDVGFLSWPFGEDLDVSPDNKGAKTNLVEFALELASRFSPIVGATRSWNSPSDSVDFYVIVDNLMNLETLILAYLLTGNRTFYDIALKHADTTLKNGVREDWSTWHVIDYNSETGAVISKETRQGFSANSTWTRGQAWAIHSYARLFQYSGASKYLDASRNMAAYFLRRAAENPDYLVWDFDAPRSEGLTTPADSSAAMIAAAALQVLAVAEMSVGNTTGSNEWLSSSQMLISQTAGYAWKPSWQSLLSNGTRNNNVHADPDVHSNNTGLPYGDYFWVKGGNYLLETQQAECPNGQTVNRLSCGIDLKTHSTNASSVQPSTSDGPAPSVQPSTSDAPAPSVQPLRLLVLRYLS
ncbi:Six-hairpin glycosidase [Auriculariales sp. MPI-PUGE-AT-0066]|nr:Six-hairpin glycosidase [Auriculariales sp. MPI-PUGE-AT-0066]